VEGHGNGCNALLGLNFQGRVVDVIVVMVFVVNCLRAERWI